MTVAIYWSRKLINGYFSPQTLTRQQGGKQTQDFKEKTRTIHPTNQQGQWASNMANMSIVI